MTLGVTGFWTLTGAIVGGWMLADLLGHPQGTTAAGNVIVSLFKNTGNQIAGR